MLHKPITHQFDEDAYTVFFFLCTVLFQDLNRHGCSQLHKSSEGLENKSITKAIALNISKAFDNKWHMELLRKLSSYGISGKNFLEYKIIPIR